MQIAAAEPVAQRLVDPAEHAAQRQRQQDEDVDDDFDEADAHLGRGVVGGLAVIDEFDAAEEIGRHPVAMGDDMVQVAQVEPEAQAGRQGQGGKKEDGEVIWVH